MSFQHFASQYNSLAVALWSAVMGRSGFPARATDRQRSKVAGVPLPGPLRGDVTMQFAILKITVGALGIATTTLSELISHSVIRYLSACTSRRQQNFRKWMMTALGGPTQPPCSGDGSKTKLRFRFTAASLVHSTPLLLAKEAQYQGKENGVTWKGWSLIGRLIVGTAGCLIDK